MRNYTPCMSERLNKEFPFLLQEKCWLPPVLEAPEGTRPTQCTQTVFTANRPSQDSRKSQPSPVTRRQWRQSRAQVLHYTSCVCNRRLRGAECGAKAPYHLWTVLGKNGDAIGWVSSYLQWAADLQSTVPGALQVLLTSHVTKFCLCLEWLPLQNPNCCQGVCTLCYAPCLMMENRAHPVKMTTQ